MNNILHLIDTVGPGGAETLFIELGNHFSNHSFKSYAIIYGSGYVEEKLKEYDIEYYIVPGKGSFNIKYLLSLIKIIKTKKIDLIHAHLFGSNIYASIAGLITNTPVLSTFHGLIDINTSDKLLNLKIKILLRGSKIIAVSQKILDHLVENTPLTPQDILLVKNGTHLISLPKETKSLFRRQHAIPDSGIIIGCLGNVRPAKDYETAIHSIKITLQKTKNIYLLIAGATDHVLYRQFEQLIEQHNLKQHIQFIGFIDDPLHFLSHLDIYLISSSSEGQPISLFQAMNAKLPIIATQCGVEDILTHNEHALLAPVQSPDSISQHLIQLINDASLAKKLSNNAYHLVNQEFNIQNMFKEYETIYASMMNHK